MARMVRALAPQRADSRDEWLKVGMAIHSFDTSPAALGLWEEFSKSSDKFKPGECARVWAGFKAEKGRAVSVASLSMMAMQDGAVPKTNGIKPKEDQKEKLWQSAKEAQTSFNALLSSADDPEAAAFLEREYGLVGGVSDWKVFTHPTMGRGLVYCGANPNGTRAYKFKSFRRNEKGKRLVCYLHGHGGALFLSPVEQSIGNVIVCGEEKAEAARRAGFTVVCPMTGENALSKEWAKYFSSQGVEYSFVLANDADKAGADANKKSAEALDEAGISNVKIVEWPEGVQDGYDLNDVLKEHGVVAVQRLLLKAKLWQPDVPGLDLWDIDRLFSYQIDERDNILGDYLLSAGELALLIGPPGIGKSRLSEQLAFDILLGRESWLGELPILRNDLRILLLQTENNQRRLQMDIGAQLKGCSYEQRRMVRGQFLFHVPTSLSDKDLALDQPENVTKLARTVRHARPDLIILDPYIDLFAGDSENDAVQTRRTIKAIFEVCHAWSVKTAILLVHHARTGREAAASAVGWDRSAYARGSKALLAVARSQINVAPGDEEGKSVVISCGKNNNGKSFKPFAAELMDDMTYRKIEDFDVDKWRSSITNSRRKEPALDISTVLCRLPEDGGAISATDLISQIVETHGCSESSARRVIHKAETSGKVSSRVEKYGFITKTYLSRKGD